MAAIADENMINVFRDEIIPFMSLAYTDSRPIVKKRLDMVTWTS